MRIAYITAGAAGMLCGSCLHDNTLAAALMRSGHDVALIPTYTPTRTDETDVSIDRVFYGAVNVYLEQKSSLFARLPAPLHRLLDRPGLLNWASSRGVSIDARQLGELTLSVLQGEEGRQRRELDELVGWLRDDFRPDIVHITNSMFLGLAGPLRRELGVPVLCSLQGEDIFLDDLVEPYRSEVHAELRAHAREVDAFVTTSDYYAGFMADYLDVAPEAMRVVHLGIALEGHGPPPEPPPDHPFVVGYLARICPEKGLHLLVEAVGDLAGRIGNDALRLRVAGYLGAGDQEYFDGVRQRVVELGLEDVFHHAGEVSRDEKIEFLQGLHVLSVPTVYREPKGLFVLEALANGVPVVLPDHGAFPELVAATGGGVLFEAGSTAALADRLDELRGSARTRRELGDRGRAAVEASFSDEVMAAATLRVYREWVERTASPGCAGGREPGASVGAPERGEPAVEREETTG